MLAALERTDIATARARRAGGDARSWWRRSGTDEQFLADLAADYGAQRINRAQFLAAQDPIHARLLLRAPARSTNRRPSLDGTAFEGVTTDSWDGLDLDQQRALARAVRRARRHPERQAGSTSSPSRVQPVPVEAG
ncbi:MAG: hypothetical protein R2706_14910 [Acidimicrobiales bacterium]